MIFLPYNPRHVRREGFLEFQRCECACRGEVYGWDLPDPVYFQEGEGTDVEHLWGGWCVCRTGRAVREGFLGGVRGGAGCVEGVGVEG